MAALTTSLVVQFGDSVDPNDAASGLYNLRAQIDSRDDGFNNGVTSFVPGDTAAYLVFASPALSITNKASSGAISQLGSGETEISEFVTFANSREANLSYEPSGSVTFTAFGSSAGGSPSVVSGTKVQIATPQVVVYRAVYNAAFVAYGLTSPTSLNGETNFPIQVVVTGDIA